MNITIAVKSRSNGVFSKFLVAKKGVTKSIIDSLVKNIKTAIPDPTKVPQVKGTDRLQILIKVDGKPTLNHKIRGVKAGLGSIALIDQMTKETAVSVTKKPAVTAKK